MFLSHGCVNTIKEIEELVEEVKVLSWRWFLTRLKLDPYETQTPTWTPDMDTDTTIYILIYL